MTYRKEALVLWWVCRLCGYILLIVSTYKLGGSWGLGFLAGYILIKTKPEA